MLRPPPPLPLISLSPPRQLIDGTSLTQLMEMPWGQTGADGLEFMINLAMSSSHNGVSCSSCAESDHPVDFPPIKAISFIVCQLTNKEPTMAANVAMVLQDDYNRAMLPLQQFRSSGLSQRKDFLMKKERSDIVLFSLTCSQYLSFKSQSHG